MNWLLFRLTAGLATGLTVRFHHWPQRLRQLQRLYNDFALWLAYIHDDSSSI